MPVSIANKLTFSTSWHYCGVTVIPTPNSWLTHRQTTHRLSISHLCWWLGIPCIQDHSYFYSVSAPLY